MNPTYFIDLRVGLLHELKSRSVVPQGATADDGKEMIAFDFVDYSDIGQPQEEDVMKLYHIARERLFGLLDKLSTLWSSVCSL